MRKRNLIATIVLTAALAGCAAESVSDIWVSVPGHMPAGGNTVLSAAPPQTVDVRTFGAGRGIGLLPGRIGERKTVGDISMGYVTIDPPPDVLLENAIVAELKAAGHRISDRPAAVEITGNVLQFAFRTDVTALYWDAVVDAALVLEVEGPGGAVERIYPARCTERTYSWPSADVIARVVGMCTDRIAAQFSGDRDVATLFSH